MKKIDTLIEDISRIFTESHKVSEENLLIFSQKIAEILKNSIESERKEQTLRISKLGTPDRKLWYELNLPDQGSGLPSNTQLKFLYGHILEELLLFLAREAGHCVEGEQKEVNISGVVGHKDCTIDGIVVDVKSASRFAFQKFANGTLHKDDPFGYIAQLSGYVHADDSERQLNGLMPNKTGAFLVINKESGDLTLLKIDAIDMIDPVKRIEHVQKLLDKPEPPVTKCYPPEPYGKSGNEVLNKNCGYCPFRKLCWGDAIKTFRYSDGLKHFTKIIELPRVEEVKT